jgi:hypothetical protein
VPPDELPESMCGMALGWNAACVLASDGAVRVPREYAGTAFVAIETDGDGVCGIMRSNPGGTTPIKLFMGRPSSIDDERERELVGERAPEPDSAEVERRERGAPR